MIENKNPLNVGGSGAGAARTALNKYTVPKCSECSYCKFESNNNNPSRYYCKHITAAKEVCAGARMICRCDRHSTELKVKSSPKWCPLKGIDSSCL